MEPRALLAAAGLPDAAPQRLSGGDMSEVWRCGDAVVKTHPRPPEGLFAAEARGLVLLASHGVPVPTLHHVDPSGRGLVMDHLPAGPAHEEALGRVIARMHQVKGTAYGSDEPVFLGRFPLPAGTGPDWAEHYATRRLEPLLRATGPALGPLAERIRALMPQVAIPNEGPRLVHGDLWSGNVFHAADGPYLIDPSAQWGHRALDLAMMQLFGGFSPRTWAAYEEIFPIDDAVRAVLPWHRLYFLLVHVHFFGSSYVDGVRRVVEHHGG